MVKVPLAADYQIHLFVIVVFRNDVKVLSNLNEISRVETDAKLTNHRHVSARAECLRESLK
jgi:hypothetical protein